jgi:hypothetical protein
VIAVIAVTESVEASALRSQAERHLSLLLSLLDPCSIPATNLALHEEKPMESRVWLLAETKNAKFSLHFSLITGI